ncbi:hypothetical protein TSAR_016120 [Trichomalopsis sarcophagae]|uniref:Uncharacterized protein n=1 Tax=Trichomalopsis sarcophagae TaxID=543379 RepID=A0A232FM84_9HYME|nr:hypothetical protein TSAR_016120 [Trichomalopsis sarcophagae]
MKKSSAINEKLCQGKDVFERMNFLYQASFLLSSKNKALASYYGSIMTSCAKKAVLRVDHNLKRTVCRACQSPLIPGKTAKVRLMPKNKLIKTVCLICKTKKQIPYKGKHKLWFDQSEALLETFEYKLKKKTTNVEKNVSNGESKDSDAPESAKKQKLNDGNNATDNKAS